MFYRILIFYASPLLQSHQHKPKSKISNRFLASSSLVCLLHMMIQICSTAPESEPPSNLLLLLPLIVRASLASLISSMPVSSRLRSLPATAFCFAPLVCFMDFRSVDKPPSSSRTAQRTGCLCILFCSACAFFFFSSYDHQWLIRLFFFFLVLETGVFLNLVLHECIQWI